MRLNNLPMPDGCSNAMSEPELVSIIVVAYNNWPDLDLAVQSALCQSYHPVEVIVVDNSSTDGTAGELEQRYSGRVNYIHQANRGDAGAYNTGFSHSRGEFIQFLDGDDVLAPDKIDRQMAVAREHPDTDIIYGDIRRFQTLPRHAAWADRTTEHHDDMLAATLAPEPLGVETILSALIRRRALQRVGPWDEAVYCTDFDYWLRAAWLGCRFRHCPGLLGFARVHPKQMSVDVSAMNRGTEAVLAKALTYIDREPYRTMVLENLAQMRYLRAVSRKGLSRDEALAKLREARETKSDEVPLPAYWMGVVAIVAPYGSVLISSPAFRAIRRFVARLVGYHIPRF